MTEAKEFSPDRDLNASLTEETSKKLEQMQQVIAESIKNYFHQAKELGEDPRTELIEHLERGAQEAEFIYGHELVTNNLNEIRNISSDSEEEFIDAYIKAMRPLLLEQISNPQVRQKELLLRHEQEKMAGIFMYDVTEAKVPFIFPDGTSINIGDPVIELSLGAGESSGHEAIKESLAQLAQIVKENPDIKAVVGFSWIFSHPVVKKLGFEVFPEIPVEEQFQQNVLTLGKIARLGKPGYDKIENYKAMWGGISKDALLKKYNLNS